VTREGPDYDLAQFFAPPRDVGARDVVIQDDKFMREKVRVDETLEIIVDRFSNDTDCAFIRYSHNSGSAPVRLRVTGDYQFETCAAGGWMLRARAPQLSHFWIPCPPQLRTTDEHGRILVEEVVGLRQIEFGTSGGVVTLQASTTGDVDLVIWRLSANKDSLIAEFAELAPCETQPYFIYGSHTRYYRPADVYAHLIFGHVYENCLAWPHFWKICDELDAYALYLILSGLETKTSKIIYRLLRRQILYSIITRQNPDGGWYHGEWTPGMESHYRLHCGGMHLLLNALEYEPSPIVRTALDKAATYLARCIDRTAIGTWLLHDSLERNVEDMRSSPFRWTASTALGKSVSNMLVLNTHIDGTIALHRYQNLTRTDSFRDLLESTRAATRTIMALRPAETLYRLIFRAISLTLLPENEAKSLPLLKRAVKRLTWQNLIPRIHRIKARFPRLVMPNGYIDRALTLQGLSHGYQSVNTWDLVRYLRCLPDEPLEPVLAKALEFTQNGSLRRYWREPKQRQHHALVFWTEALYHQCMAHPDPQYRTWLAAAMLDIEDLELGQPPSLLGSNSEAVAAAVRCPCLILSDGRLRVANLSNGDRYEFLVVNPQMQALALSWQSDGALDIYWRDANGRTQERESVPTIAPRGWLLGIGSRQQTVKAD